MSFSLNIIFNNALSMSLVFKTNKKKALTTLFRYEY